MSSLDQRISLVFNELQCRYVELCSDRFSWQTSSSNAGQSTSNQKAAFDEVGGANSSETGAVKPSTTGRLSAKQRR